MSRLNVYGMKLGIVFIAFIQVLANASEVLSTESNNTLSLQKAIRLAQQNDPWLTGNVHQQKSLEYMSSAVSSLSDPKVSLGIANLPSDSWESNQEAMTQFTVGITQVFPRGDTLAIRQRQLQQQSEAYPFQREDRKAKVAVTVGNLWLDAYRVQQSIALIERNRNLFEQLADVAEANYSSTLGKTRQQDIVRAQLELTRLDERLDILAQQKKRYEGMLSQWLLLFPSETSTTDLVSGSLFNTLPLSHVLPQIDLLNATFVHSAHWKNPQALLPFLKQHPSVIAIDKKVSATQSGILLAKQSYKPEWGVNASYGYREDAPTGQDRADLFSVGVTFDLPIFTENRQDKHLQSAISQTEAVKTEKLLRLRELLGAYASAKGRLQRLKARQSLYKEKLLPQIHDQADASLSAYTHDDGDFSEVVRARIAVLNAEIDEITLNVEEQKIHLELNYLLVGSTQTLTHENNMKITHSAHYTNRIAMLGAK